MGLPDVAEETIPPYFRMAPSACNGHSWCQLGNSMRLREVFLAVVRNHGVAHNAIAVLPTASLAHGGITGQG